MSFFQENENNNYRQNKKTYLRARKNSHKKLLSIVSGKRISLFFSQTLMGSMTVEAAMVIPIFLFFICNIIFVFDIFRLHGNLAGALHQTGNQIAISAYTFKNEKEGEGFAADIGTAVISAGYIKNKVLKLLGTPYLENSGLVTGVSGLDFSSKVLADSDEVIDISAYYKMKPLIGIPGFPDIAMQNRYYAKAWTGYDVEHKIGAQNGDRLVYIAITGSVYHNERSCTYLNPSIKTVSFAETETIRNENRAKYYPCERCGSGKLNAVLFITNQGNRYHGDFGCSGLKRTVLAIHLSEAGGRRGCSKCVK